MTEELRVFLATIYGEAAGSSPAAWKAIASVIMNRVGVREWRKHKTPLAVIQNTGFDAYTHRNGPYKVAYKVLEVPAMAMPGSTMNRLMEAVTPIYAAGIRTTDAQLYFSPKAQIRLNREHPKKWAMFPKWAASPLLERVQVLGTEKDDFAFFRYKPNPQETKP